MKHYAVGAVVFLVVCLGQAGAAFDQPIREPEEVTRAYAEMGDPASQFNMALLCEKRGTPKDKEEAIAWFRKSAAQGFLDAQFNLGIHLANGDGVAKNETDAVRWFHAAAMQGSFAAQKALIKCYGLGMGLKKDPVQALLWDFRARQTLRTRFAAEAGEPSRPGKLRADGFVEFFTKKGELQAIKADGSVETANADGTKSIKRADGGTTAVAQSGEKVTKFPDGGEMTEYADGRTVSKDRKGTIERKFPDGTREVEGDGTSTSGKKVRIIEKFDSADVKISQKIIDGIQAIVKLADGGIELETSGTDEVGTKVRIVERLRGDEVIQRQVIREDGVERKEGDIWIIRRWINTADGKMAKLKEKYGPGLALTDLEQKVVEIAEREDASPTAAAMKAPGSPGGPPRSAGTAVMPPTMVPARKGDIINEGMIRNIPTPPPEAMVFTTQVSTPSVNRPKTSISPQLADLEKIEREVLYFAGATDADFERLGKDARSFHPNLLLPPQKAGPANWLAMRLDQMAAPPIPPPLRELPTDGSDRHPLGLHGRMVINSLKWKHAETEHFVVHYLQAADAYPVMQFIECAYFTVTQTLRIETSKSRRKSHVFVYPNVSEWQTFASSLGMPEAVAGFAYKDELLLGAPEDRDAYLKTLCHEAAHAIVAHFYPGKKWPLWLNEGFANFMAAKTVALRRNHQIQRYLSRDSGTVSVENVFNRTHYGDVSSPGANAEVVQFYAQSEKCVRILLGNLGSEGFAKFANLAFSENAMSVCLQEAASQSINSPEKFEALVNKGALP